MTPRTVKMPLGRFGFLLGAVLLFPTVFAYPERSLLPSTETAACAGEGDFLDRVETCARCKDDSKDLSLEQLMKYPLCAFRVLTDECNYSNQTAVLWAPMLVVFVAILMEQSISGFRGALPLAFVLSGVALFSAIFAMKGQLGSSIPLYLVLLCLAALFGGAAAHWIVYVRDLLPVAALGLGLFGLFYFLRPEGLQEATPLPESVAWAAGALGGVWLHLRRRRTAKSPDARQGSDGTRIEKTPGNGSSTTQ